MALPTAYLTSVKNLEGMLNAIQGAQAPEKFTQKFLESLEFKSNPDRLIISVLKSLAFLDDGGKPTKRYFSYLDQSQSQRILAEGIREAYADLFKVNIKAQNMTFTDVVNKLKTLSEGKLSEAVVKKMATTFLALVKHADFTTDSSVAKETESENEKIDIKSDDTKERSQHKGSPFGGDLVYNIQIILPESRDPAVYDAIFKSMRDHM